MRATWNGAAGNLLRYADAFATFTNCQNASGASLYISRIQSIDSPTFFSVERILRRTRKPIMGFSVSTQGFRPVLRKAAPTGRRQKSAFRSFAPVGGRRL